MINLLNCDLHDLEAFFLSLGENRYRAVQACQFMHQQGGSDFSTATCFSKNLRQKLLDTTVFTAPHIAKETVCEDGTIKWLMQVSCGNHIETVYIPEKTRATLCVSSQVGCMLNCTFCATGSQGFNRNLSLAEILGQLWQARHLISEKKLQPITNIVFMGMGEPLLNLEPVLKSISVMQSDYGYALARRRITVSTSGVVPKLVEMTPKTNVALAISLHAPNDALRNQLVPLNKKYPISELLLAAKNYLKGRPKEKVTIEYVLLKDTNDTLAHANELAHLLQCLPCKINLIPFNRYFGARYDRSQPGRIVAFRDRLMRAGFVTTIRKERGGQVGGACGQLVGAFDDKTKRRARHIQTQLRLQQKQA